MTHNHRIEVEKRTGAVGESPVQLAIKVGSHQFHWRLSWGILLFCYKFVEVSVYQFIFHFLILIPQKYQQILSTISKKSRNNGKFR